MWLKQDNESIGILVSKITLLLDNQTTINLIANEEFRKQSKQIDVVYNYIKGNVQKGFYRRSTLIQRNKLSIS